MNITISATNDQGLLDPPPLIYAAAPPAITSWPDSSASANNASPVGAPQLINNAINGHKAVQFKAATQDGFNLSAGILATRPFTIFAVMKKDAINKSAWALGGDGTANCPFFVINLDGTIYLGNRIEYVYYNNPANDAAWHVYVGLFHGSAYAQAAVDLVMAPTLQGGNAVTATYFTTLGYGATPAPGTFSDFMIAEIIYFDWGPEILGLPWQGISAFLGAEYNLPQAGSPAPVDPASLSRPPIGWWKGDSVLQA